MALKEIINQINSKPASEWEKTLRESMNAGRAWVHDNPELAALVGFLSGICVVLFFRIFAWIFFIAFVWIAILWLMMPEEVD